MKQYLKWHTKDLNYSADNFGTTGIKTYTEEKNLGSVSFDGKHFQWKRISMENTY